MKNTSKNVKIANIVKRIKSGNIVFNNKAQRTEVWNDYLKSNLIYSLLSGVNVGLVSCSVHNNVYDVLDGQQRLKSINHFINNDFRLVNIKEVFDETENKFVDINGLYFHDLSEQLQENILQSYITFVEYTDLDFQKEVLLFKLLNNMKPVSPIILARNESSVLEDILKLEKHSIFNDFSIPKLKSNIHTRIILQSLVIIYSEEKDLSIKNITRELKKDNYNKLKIDTIKKLFDDFVAIKQLIIKLDNERATRKIISEFKKQLNIVNLIYMLHYAMTKGIEIEVVKDWILWFYLEDVVFYPRYKELLTGMTTRRNRVAERIDILTRAFETYIKL